MTVAAIAAWLLVLAAAWAARRRRREHVEDVEADAIVAWLRSMREQQ